LSTIAVPRSNYGTAFAYEADNFQQKYEVAQARSGKAALEVAVAETIFKTFSSWLSGQAFLRNREEYVRPEKYDAPPESIEATIQRIRKKIAESENLD
jgi:hypothetical protein